MVREHPIGVRRPSARPHPRSPTCPLDSRQQTPARHVQIRQVARDEESIGIFRQPAVVDCGPLKDLLDHQEHMFDFGTDFRLGAVAGWRCLAQRPMAMGFRLDEALGTASVLPDRVALPAIGRIASHASLLPMQQLRQHLTVMHIRRGGRHEVDQFGPTVYPNMSSHAEVPLVALLRLMPHWISLLLALLRRTGRRNNGRIRDGPPPDCHALRG